VVALISQHGVATREQLCAAGLRPALIDAHLDGRRWQRLNDGVICTHNGPLTTEQARWAVVLSAQPPRALCGLTAMELWGVRSFPTSQIHVVVRRGARVMAVPGLDAVVHESRRFFADDVVRCVGLPATSLERSVVDAAVWSRDTHTATRIVVAPVQQRRTDPGRLYAELVRAGKVRHRRSLLPFLGDLAGGAEALSEVEFLRWCRRHRFPKPAMNVRLDSAGRRRYLDAQFVRPDGSVIDVEIDGGVHLTLATRWLDTAKDNDAVLAGRTSLRFPSVALYTDDPRAVAQLRKALRSVSA
jgi:hypothetical protein